MTQALAIDSVVKRYDDHLAVDQLSISIPRGAIYGILGPNGAGKTTTIRMVMNIIARDGGSISVLGKDPAADASVLRSIGYLPEERGLYRKMKVLDVIVFFAELKGMQADAAKKSALTWLEKMGLGEYAQARVETLSKGMQQKVQFIATILHGPELLILDEPASGLDPVNQEVLRAAILEAKQQGRTIIFSTHNMEQAEQLCDSVCIIAGGRKVLDGNLKTIKRAHADSRYALEFESNAEAERAANALRHSSMAAGEITQVGTRVEFALTPNKTSSAILSTLANVDAALQSFMHLQPSLRDIFVRYASASIDRGTKR